MGGDSRTDRELVETLNRGDEPAFAALYYRYRDWVLSLSIRCTGHEEDAWDVLQETFRYVLGKRPHLKLTASMTTFLYPVVKNLAIAARKKRARLGRSIEPGGDEEEGLAMVARPQAVEPGTQRALLAEVISALPETHREVVLMRFADDMSLEEIGTALAIPTGTVKSRLHHALAALREDPRTREYFEPALGPAKKPEKR